MTSTKLIYLIALSVALTCGSIAALLTKYGTLTWWQETSEMIAYTPHIIFVSGTMLVFGAVRIFRSKL